MQLFYKTFHYHEGSSSILSGLGACFRGEKNLTDSGSRVAFKSLLTLPALVFLLWFVPTHAEASRGAIKVDGHVFIPVEEVARVYRLEGYRPGKSFSVASGSTRLSGTAASSILNMAGTRFFLTRPILQRNGKLYLSKLDVDQIVTPVLNPGGIRARAVQTVVIDPGHGGHDTGARGRVGHEKTFALDVSLRTARLLRRQGFRVVLTRDSDRFIPLPTRVAMSNQVKNAIFVSIHFNHGRSSSAGTETYALSPAGAGTTNAARGRREAHAGRHPGNARDKESLLLAASIQSALAHRVKSPDRGVKFARFHVLRNNTNPSVLVEGGFINSPAEGRRIADGAHRERLASAIASGIVNYQRSIGSGRPGRRVAASADEDDSSGRRRSIFSGFRFGRDSSSDE
ncbi:MAG: N-acetylmuramoyl-L-alanine amidase [Verrucomicrobiales bacterium]